jgi:hypothetical protein
VDLVQLESNMSKPVLVIRFPGYWKSEQWDVSRKAIYDNKPLNEDYHVMVLVDNEVEEVKFECYNSPHEPEKLEEITKLVRMSIERCLRQEEDLRKKQKENEKNI